jgi:putative pyruvate formate lyase activating enzyme
MVNFIENIKKLYDMSRKCCLCPHNCGVNRFKNEKGFCKASLHPYVADVLIHFYEESVISGENGSGAIFFSSCNMRCLYCQNYEISTNLIGKQYYPEELSELMLSMQCKNVHNINLVSPTHNIASIAEAIYIARSKGLTIPVIYNCGGYENISTIDLLDGLIDIYLPDFKYSDNIISYKLSQVRDYPFYAAISVKKMYEQVGSLILDGDLTVKGLLIRHLVLPGFIDNSVNVLYLIRDMINSHDVSINLMNQYHRAYKANSIKKLNKELSFEEYNYVLNKAISLGFKIIR